MYINKRFLNIQLNLIYIKQSQLSTKNDKGVIRGGRGKSFQFLFYSKKKKALSVKIMDDGCLVFGDWFNNDGHLIC